MRRRRRAPTGTTLIEICSVVTIVGIVASCTAVVLRNAYQIHSQSLRVVTKMRSLDWLRERVVRDSAVASKAQANGGLTLIVDDETRIEYRQQAQLIWREKISKGKVIARDRWTFFEPLRFSATIEDFTPCEQGFAGQRISMTVVLEQSPVVADSWTFLARVGIWRGELNHGE